MWIASKLKGNELLKWWHEIYSDDRWLVVGRARSDSQIGKTKWWISYQREDWEFEYAKSSRDGKFKRWSSKWVSEHN